MSNDELAVAFQTISIICLIAMLGFLVAGIRKLK